MVERKYSSEQSKIGQLTIKNYIFGRVEIFKFKFKLKDLQKNKHFQLNTLVCIKN